MAQQVQWSEPRPGVGQVLLDAPPRNILASDAWQAFEVALAELRARAARVVVIGSVVEGFFMAHGSLERIIDVFTGGSGGDVDAQRRVLRELDSGPMVSIVAVEGQAWGGGAELCWACDLRVAAPAASFAQPEATSASRPDGAARRRSRISPARPLRCGSPSTAGR